MTILIELLMKETVVGAIMGSLITLMGIIISYYFQHKIRKDDREKELKSQIFMNAAEQLSIFKSILINLPIAPIEELGKMPNYDIAITKLSIVATNETVKAVTLLSTALLENFFHLLPERQLIDIANGNIKILSSQLEASFQKQHHLLNEMTAYNLRNDTNSQLWKKLQENFDFYSQEIEKAGEERDKEFAILNKLRMELLIKCLETTNNLSNLEIDALSSIRKELDMTFDKNEYENNIKSSNAKMQKELNNLFEKLSNI